MATVGPEVVAEVAARLGRSGVAVVDAPVSGGVQRAAAGDLLIMVSGADDAVGQARPLLGALARSAPLVGPVAGDGQRMKLVNQLLCGVHIAAAAEALAFAESLGLDPGECWRVLRDGAAASFMFEDRGQRMITGEFREPRSALDIFVKDMGLVSAAAEHAGAPAPLAGGRAAAVRAGARGGPGPPGRFRADRGAAPGPAAADLVRVRQRSPVGGPVAGPLQRDVPQGRELGFYPVGTPR